MKKTKVITALLLIIVLAASLAACSDRTKQLGPVTITFVTNVENITIEPIVLDGKSDQFMPDDPVRAGFIFVGWFYDEALTRRFNVEDGITTDITLYAKWQRQSSLEPPDDPILVESGGFSYEQVDNNYYIVGYHGTNKDITIPATYNLRNVIGIKPYAFRNNSTIETVTISSVLQTIAEGVFENCVNLRSFTVAGSDYFESENGILMNRDKDSILQVGMAAPNSAFVIPKKVDKIREGAFFGCTFSITFEQGSAYTAIDRNDFYGFKGALTIGSNITAINQYGLNNFQGTLIFAANAGIAELGLGSFDGYKGAKVTLPASVTKIGEHAFSNCQSEVDISAANIDKIGKYAFSNYKGSKIVIPSHITALEEGAFHTSSAKVIFAQGCTIATVPYLAFGRFLGEVYFPQSFTSVAAEAFWSLQGGAKVEFANTEANMTIAQTAFDSSRDGKVFFGVSR